MAKIKDGCEVARCRRDWDTHYNCNGINLKLCAGHRDRLYDLIEQALDAVRGTGRMAEYISLIPQLSS